MTRGEGADLPSNDTPSARSAGRRFWISTVSLDHVEGAIEGGFTQADHGANTRLHRPRPGDLMVFYSPRTNLHGGIPVRQFTALATVTVTVTGTGTGTGPTRSSSARTSSPGGSSSSSPPA